MNLSENLNSAFLLLICSFRTYGQDLTRREGPAITFGSYPALSMRPFPQNFDDDGVVTGLCRQCRFRVARLPASRTASSRHHADSPNLTTFVFGELKAPERFLERVSALSGLLRAASVPD